jgi:hypothetical protein
MKLGRPRYTSNNRPTLLEKILARTEKPSNSECWLWTGYIDLDGYGRFNVDGKRRRAHQISFELFHGLVPAGHVIDHLCRVRRCINPKHLEAVTPRENLKRGESWWGKTQTELIREIKRLKSELERS